MKKQPVFKLLVIAFFLFLVGSFVAYNSGLFTSTEKPGEKPLAPKKEVQPADGTDVQPDTVSLKEPAIPEKRVKKAATKRATQTDPANQPANGPVDASTENDTGRRTYFPSSKSIIITTPPHFDLKPESSIKPIRQQPKKRKPDPPENKPAH